MKNHFERNALSPDLDDAALDVALDASPEHDGATSSGQGDLDAAREILRDAERRMHYRRVHLQYRAMGAALDLLDAPGAVDSNRWHERLVEFVPSAADD